MGKLVGPVALVLLGVLLFWVGHTCSRAPDLDLEAILASQDSVLVERDSQLRMRDEEIRRLEHKTETLQQESRAAVEQLQSQVARWQRAVARVDTVLVTGEPVEPEVVVALIAAADSMKQGYEAALVQKDEELQSVWALVGAQREQLGVLREQNETLEQYRRELRDLLHAQRPVSRARWAAVGSGGTLIVLAILKSVLE